MESKRFFFFRGDQATISKNAFKRRFFGEFRWGEAFVGIRSRHFFTAVWVFTPIKGNPQPHSFRAESIHGFGVPG